MIQLRPYQLNLIEIVRQAFRDGHRRVCSVAPTGAGKTVCFSYISQAASAKGNRVIILTHRAEILDQISKALTVQGCEHGIIQAGKQMNFIHKVQVASVQSLSRRLDLVPVPDLIVADEFHHFSAKSFVKVLNHWNKARLLGVTATPERLDGKGLNEIADVMVLGPTVAWLIDQGFLSKPIYYAPERKQDLKGIRKKMGDFAKDELEKAVDKPTIIGDAVDHYKRICPGEQAIAFCVSIQHSEHICAAFQAAGFDAESIDGSMDRSKRSGIMERFRGGATRILTSVDLIGEGVDVPAVTAAMLLRPTMSLGLHLQQIGRALRLAPGKQNAIILDHAGNIDRHGLAETEREWSLAGVDKKTRKSESTGIRTCKKCYAMFKGPRCLQCDTAPEVENRELEEGEGELKQLTEDEKHRLSFQRKSEEKTCKTVEDFTALGKKRGYQHPEKWAQHRIEARRKYSSKYVNTYAEREMREYSGTM